MQIWPPFLRQYALISVTGSGHVKFHKNILAGKIHGSSACNLGQSSGGKYVVKHGASRACRKYTHHGHFQQELSSSGYDSGYVCRIRIISYSPNRITA